MMRVELNNDKRKIAKVLNNIEDLQNCTVNVFTWVNDCWSEEMGDHDSYSIMVEVEGKRVFVDWKTIRVTDENKFEENKAIHQAFKLTCELAKWVHEKYGVLAANDEWCIFD